MTYLWNDKIKKIGFSISYILKFGIAKIKGISNYVGKNSEKLEFYHIIS